MGCGSRQYKQMYRGVFVSPLDYELNMSTIRLAQFKKSSGKELTKREIRAILRLEELKSMGGIDERFRIDYTLTINEFEI